MNAKAVISLALIILLALFGGGTYLYDIYKSSKIEKEIDLLLVRDYAYISGDKNAKVTVVEFFDPACPACVAKGPLVAKLPEIYTSQVRVVYRSLALHNGSDLVLSLLEAAKEQGKFNEALAAFYLRYTNWFINNQANAFVVWGVLEQSGVNIEKAREFLDNNQAKINDMMRQNREDAAALGVEGTPTFFVNGKKIKQIELTDAIKNEIEKIYEGKE
ncbi:MAG: DsbA family protein [Campylobacteraceae bacterium]|jgi:protein-disulfide isomerase|nr:DsbA family protein [Campylobacteraceae bacterium]